MPAPMVVWDPGMLAYDLGGRHPLHPLRWQLTWSLAEQLGVLAGVDRFAPAPATDAELARIHTPEYIAAVRAISAGGRPTSGPPGRYGIGTTDTPAFPGIHESAALIAGGSIAAARAVADRTVDRAVHIAGGLHHAMADHASGFCVYNDAALAIATLLDRGVRRVAYVDVDVHHGDGVQAAFADDPRVLTVSLHESPATLFPGTGWADEIGEGAAEGTVVNLPLPAGTGDTGWLRAFDAVVPALVRSFAPEVLVTQHGTDSHAEDPLADLRVSVDGHRETYRRLRRLALEVTGGRWLAVGGGGYALVRVVPRSWTHLLALVLDRDLDPTTATPAAWREEARHARPHIVPPDSLTDGRPGPLEVPAWSGQVELPVDRVIGDVRNRLFPLHGLDPHDPRD